MKFTALMLACAASAMLGVSVRTEQTKPHYDAATIKRCQPEENPGPARGTAGGTNATFSPGRFFVPCVTTEQLIYLAYVGAGAQPDERLAGDSGGGPSDDKKISGGPAWVHSLKEKYQIEATAAGATERTVLMGTMLRSLLEDRFQLKLHRESEDEPMFALTVAKSGFKLKPMKPGDCDDNAAPLTDLSIPSKPPCHSQMTRANGPSLVWIFGGGDMDALAAKLSRPAGLHVVDRTGIKGEFIIRFEFEPDTIFTALEEQLGLKLEKIKAPRGFIVIDHIERPSPNRPVPAALTAAPRYWYNLYHDKTY